MIRSSRFWACLVLGVGVGLATFLARPMREKPSMPPAVREAHRSQLELRAGRWTEPSTGTAFTGHLLETYDGGTLKSRSNVSNGLLEGRSEGWYPEGDRQIEESFLAGVSHGRRTKWHSNGNRQSEATIVAGELHGPFRRWHENGVLAEAMNLNHGLPDGVSRAYYPSGCLRTEARFRDGHPVAQESWNDGDRPARTPTPQLAAAPVAP